MILFSKQGTTGASAALPLLHNPSCVGRTETEERKLRVGAARKDSLRVAVSRPLCLSAGAFFCKKLPPGAFQG